MRLLIPNEGGVRSADGRTLAGWGVFLLGVVVFLNSLGNGFAYDDIHIVLNNDPVHHLGRWTELVTSPYWPGEFGVMMGLWRPGATVMYALQWAVGDGSPLVFHVVNVLLHGVVSVLVLALLLRLMPFVPAVVGAVLFAVHPVHTEAVANVVGFAELFTAATTLAACLIYLGAEGRPRAGRTLMIAGLFGLGMLTKESAATLPALLVLLDAYRRDLRLSDLPGYLWPRAILFGSLVATGGLVLFARGQVLDGFPMPLPPMGAELLTEIPRIWTVTVIWLHYVRLLFFPLDLSADYSPGVIDVRVGWELHSLLGLGVGLAFLTLAWWAWRAGGPSSERGSARVVGLGIMWFIVSILPASNVLFLSGTLLGERLLYLPSVGFSMAAGWVFWKMLPHRRAVAVLGLALMVSGFTWRTVERNPSWKSMTTVFETMTRDHPEAGRAHWILGDQLWGRKQVGPALRMYRLALGTLNNHYPLLIHVTRKLLGIERPAQAERLARMAWELEPEGAGAPGLLSLALLDQGRYAEAIQPGEIALERSGGDEPLLLHILSRAYHGAGRTEDAIRARELLIESGKSSSPFNEWLWLAQLRHEAGNVEGARRALERATDFATTASEQEQVRATRQSWAD